MQYLLLIYSNEEVNKKHQGPQLMTDYTAFTKSIQENGNMVAGDALLPVETARTVRVRGGDVMVTDGPFAETQEQLGGYYLVEAADMDEAVGIAQKIPTAKYGCIEVRPVMIWEA